MYDRDALLAAVDLRALAGRLLGPPAGNGRSGMWRCPNPHHAQTGLTPPVSIFTSRRGEQRWRCHGCGDGGTAIDLVLACRGGTTRDAMSYLAERAGQRELPVTWQPASRPTAEWSVPPGGCRDPEGLDRYVNQCAERLWTPQGRSLRRWLTDARVLPEDVLAVNRVGGDLGPRRQPRPDGIPKVAGVVLPTIRDRRAVWAQIRTPYPWPGGSRYLNATADLAANPRLSHIRPVEVRHPEVLVTEGAIDALSAAAAGYRAVAVLSAGYGDGSVAVALAKLPHPLVIAFDSDHAGRAGANQLASRLEARDRPPTVVDLGAGDLNDLLRRAADWPAQMARAVDSAVTQNARSIATSVSR